MTYDILNKVSKPLLIAWLREHVQLPDISDEEFVRQIKLLRLQRKEEHLMALDEDLTARMEAAMDDDPLGFMVLMAESDDISQALARTAKKISRLEQKNSET